jgi:hypothetical protein
VEQQLAEVTNLAYSLSERLDAYQASQVISDQLINEFADWKQHNPVPNKPLVSVCVGTNNRGELLTTR